MQYRREIDGLRAIAVLPVILFHAGFGLAPGGFVGVDVFFVISGYLITRIILSDLAAGSFSFAGFYERRSRRILPALFVMLSACVVCAWLWLPPADMKEFARSLSYVPLFGSNIFFSKELGYFDSAAELKPLLHTWSLAVEEQYYLLFPLVLVALWKRARSAIPYALLIVALVSIGVAEHQVANRPESAFYLLPSRVWELLCGALVAWATMQGMLPARGSQAGSVLGLLLVGYAIFFFDSDTAFPGVNALVPVVGAALVIGFASPATVVGRLLGTRVLVGVGLVSYSAYLWHQPVFVFARHRSFENLGVGLALALCALTFALAYLSWRFVEQPVRRRGVVSLGNLVTGAVALSVAVLVFGAAGRLTDGFDFRHGINSRLPEVAQRMRPNHGLDEDCGRLASGFTACATHPEPEVLVWGDSYAMHLVDGFLASKEGARIAQATRSACGPILGVAPVVKGRVAGDWASQCIAFNDEVFARLKSTPSIRYVVLGSLFSQYFADDSRVVLRDGEVGSGGSIAYEHMVATLERIRELGVTPVVFSPPPGNGTDIGRCLVRAALLDRSRSVCDFALDAADGHMRAVRDFLAVLDETFEVVWLADGLCVDGVCRASAGDTLIYRDAGHLSREGSALLGKTMDFYGLVAVAGAGAGGERSLEREPGRDGAL
jgi:peptidoglycan/LPS O-acetylase OafA/YrhL